jgi:hypothetical protein
MKIVGLIGGGSEAILSVENNDDLNCGDRAR